jgi:predicted Zn-dependent peptidase
MSIIDKTYLKNGLTVVTEEMPDALSTTIGVWVRNGSRFESKKERGISHFIEHMLFKGTEKRSPLDIAGELECVGGVLNAFTGREYTCYYAKVLNKDLPLATDLLADIVINSTFDKVELDRERLVILQEISMVDDTPDDIIHDEFAASMWRGHPLGSPVLGTEKTVGAFTRDDLVEFYRSRYYPENMLITVAGGVKTRSVLRLLKKAFAGGIGDGEEVKRVLTKPASMKGVKLIRKPLEQAHLCMGMPVSSQTHPDRYKLYVLNTMLGGGMSSRLFQEIREKRGLAYSVYSYLSLVSDAGSLVIYAGTSAKDFKKVVNLVLKELKAFASGGITTKEFSRAKEQLKGGMLLGLETSDSRMMKLARDEMYYGRYVPVKEVVAEIDKLTLRTVKSLAARVLRPGDMTLVAIGKLTRRQLPTTFKTKKLQRISK